jgi:predicted transcriptional regulator
MDASLTKQAEALAALSRTDRVRLERLAARAEVSPEVIWDEVWRYGFADIEESVEADLAAQEDIAAGRTIPHEEVMAQARRILDSNVRRKRKSG